MLDSWRPYAVATYSRKQYIPETKNVTLEHIERKLMAGEKLRNIGV